MRETCSESQERNVIASVILRLDVAFESEQGTALLESIFGSGVELIIVQRALVKRAESLGITGEDIYG